MLLVREPLQVCPHQFHPVMVVANLTLLLQRLRHLFAAAIAVILVTEVVILMFLSAAWVQMLRRIWHISNSMSTSMVCRCYQQLLSSAVSALMPASLLSDEMSTSEWNATSVLADASDRGWQWHLDSTSSELFGRLPDRDEYGGLENIFDIYHGMWSGNIKHSFTTWTAGENGQSMSTDPKMFFSSILQVEGLPFQATLMSELTVLSSVTEVRHTM